MFTLILTAALSAAALALAAAAIAASARKALQPQRIPVHIRAKNKRS